MSEIILVQINGLFFILSNVALQISLIQGSHWDFLTSVLLFQTFEEFVVPYHLACYLVGVFMLFSYDYLTTFNLFCQSFFSKEFCAKMEKGNLGAVGMYKLGKRSIKNRWGEIDF